jgi:hypothetical protein
MRISFFNITRRNKHELISLIFIPGYFLRPVQCGHHDDHHLGAAKTKGQDQFFPAATLYTEVSPSIQKDNARRNGQGRFIILLVYRLDQFGVDSGCGGVYF